jgi:four helix bundle protein
MTNELNNFPFNLEERTLNYAKRVRLFIKSLEKTISNIEDTKQLIRSSGSVGANYIEANESLSKKDFIMRLKISKKEIKESRFWLRLMEVNEPKLNQEREQLIAESTEQIKIFSTIIKRVE